MRRQDAYRYPCPLCGALAGEPCTYVRSANLTHETTRSGAVAELKAKVGTRTVHPHNARRATRPERVMPATAEQLGQWLTENRNLFERMPK